MRASSPPLFSDVDVVAGWILQAAPDNAVCHGAASSSFPLVYSPFTFWHPSLALRVRTMAQGCAHPPVLNASFFLSLPPPLSRAFDAVLSTGRRRSCNEARGLLQANVHQAGLGELLFQLPWAPVHADGWRGGWRGGWRWRAWSDWPSGSWWFMVGLAVGLAVGFMVGLADSLSMRGKSDTQLTF